MAFLALNRHLVYSLVYSYICCLIAVQALELNPAKWQLPPKLEQYRPINIAKNISHAINPINWLHSGIDLSTGFINHSVNILKDLSKLKSVLQGSKHVLAGLPIKYISAVMNVLCPRAGATKSVLPDTTPDMEELSLTLHTACKQYTGHLLQIEKFLQVPEFNSNNKLVIYVAGWSPEEGVNTNIEQMAKAYNCRGDTNLLVLNIAPFAKTLLSWCSMDTETVGQYLALALIKLAQHMPLDQIHLIGHSLGAHVVGAAGRNFTLTTNRVLPRITALDPAKACFHEGEKLLGLSRGDAEFVDVIHSNPGILGKAESLGDADFYPGGATVLPPGCLNIVCAHDKAWQYYVESVYPGNENNFLATRCNSLRNVRLGYCSKQTEPMGFAAKIGQKGNFYLDVNRVSPFGQQNRGASSVPETCGLCVK